jgi:hypothetical protein
MPHPTGTTGKFVQLAAAFVLALATSLARSAPSLETPPRQQPQVGDKLAPCKFTDIRYLPRSLRDFVSDKDPVHKRAFVISPRRQSPTTCRFRS